ncbi:hypothetical protein [Methylobacterium fujisawaense]
MGESDRGKVTGLQGDHGTCPDEDQRKCPKKFSDEGFGEMHDEEALL